MSLKDKKNVGLITGASSGIGAALAIRISEKYNHLYISGRNISKLEKINDKILKNDCECTIVPLDLKKTKLIDELASQIYLKEGKLDLLISAAGIIHNLSPVTSIKDDNFEETFKINVLSNIKLLTSFQPLLKLADESKLIFILSEYDSSMKPFWGGYLPLSNMLHEIVLTFANESTGSSISTNIVCPKGVDTNFRNVFMPGEDKAELMTPIDFANEFIKLYENKFYNNGSVHII